MKFSSPLSLVAAAVPFLTVNIDARELQQIQCSSDEIAIMLDPSNPFVDPIGFLFDLVDCGGDLGNNFYSNNCVENEILSLGLSEDCAVCWSRFRNEANNCFEECHLSEFRDPFECEQCINTQGNARAEFGLESCTGINFFEDINNKSCTGPFNEEANFEFLPFDTQFVFDTRCKGNLYGDDFNVEACIKGALLNSFFASEDCLTCITEHAFCVNDFCPSECGEAREGDCFECVGASPCAQEFDNCSGLPFYENQGLENNNQAAIFASLGLFGLVFCSCFIYKAIQNA